MTNWRPEGWDKAPLEILALSPEKIKRMLITDAYEAGADAMLEGLKKEGEYKPKEWVGDAFGLHIAGGGHIVFIPEETDG